MKNDNQNPNLLKKRTKQAVLGTAVVATLGGSVVPAAASFAATETPSEIYQIDNPYKLLTNALSSTEFKQACNERNAKKVSDILGQAGIVVKASTNAGDVAQARMAIAPVVAVEVVAILSIAALAVAVAIVRDAPEVNVLENLRVQDPGIRFVLNDIYKETGDVTFVRECYDVIVLPQSA